MKGKLISRLSIILVAFFMLTGTFMGVFMGNYEKTNTVSPINTSENKEIQAPSDQTLPAASFMFADSLDMAEAIARSLYNSIDHDHNGPGFAWDGYYGNQTVQYTSYGNGASGIGMFLLDLYEKTHNSTYLEWADNVGIWLNYINSTYNGESLGKWPLYQGETNGNNYTGLAQGAAGIGLFLTELYKYTQNTTYKDLAMQTANTLISSELPVAGTTAKRVPYKDYRDTQWATIQPNDTTTDPIKWQPIIGEYETGTTPDDTAVWANYLQLNANLTTNITIINDYDVNNSQTYYLGDDAYPLTEASAIIQTFKSSHYPFYIDPDEGIKVYMNSTGTSPYAYVTLSVYEVNENGYPSTQIGGDSNKWYISELNNTQAKWVTFNWTGIESQTPVLDGDSPYGYCFKLTFYENSFVSQNEYFLVRSITDNGYSDGSMTLVKNGLYSKKTLQDLAFKIINLQSSRSLQLKTMLNGSDGFGLTSKNEISDIINITIKAFIQSNISLTADDYIKMQIKNVKDDTWETIGSISTGSTETNITKFIPINEVENYITGAPLFTIQTRFIGGAKSTNIALRVKQYNVSLYFKNSKFAISWADGAAGVGEFYLKCYETFNDDKYLEEASYLASFLVDSATLYYIGGTSLRAFWEYDNKVKFGLQDGSAGIGEFLLHISQYNNSKITTDVDGSPQDLTYGDVALAAARHIIESSTSEIYVYDRLGNYIQGGGIYWEERANNEEITNPGLLTGMAGIGVFLLDVLENNGPIHHNVYNPDSDIYKACRQIANYLIADKIGYRKNTNGSIENHYEYVLFRNETNNGTQTVSRWADGSSGILQFMSRLQQQGFVSIYGDVISMGLKGLEETALATQNGLYWDNELFASGQSLYGYFYGLAGIGEALLHLGVRARDGLEKAYSVSDLVDIDWSDLGLKNGLTDGLAGIGYSDLLIYERSMNGTYYSNAIKYADVLTDPSNWTVYSNTATVIANNTENGYAGLGVFLLEMYKVSRDDTYLDAAIGLADKLVDTQTLSGAGYGGWWYSNDTQGKGKYYTSINKGTAGIVNYLLDLYIVTQNASYLQSAEIGLWGLESIQDASGYWTSEYGASTEDTAYNGYYYGIPGIADVFLKAYEITGNTTYYTTATDAIDYLINKYTTHNALYETMTSSSDEYIGLEKGYAGFLKLLYHAYSLDPTNTTYYNTIIDCTEYVLGLATESGGSLYWYDYYVSGAAGTTSISLGYSKGMVGLVEVLSEIYSVFPSSGLFTRENIINAIYKAKRYLMTADGFDTASHGFITGFNGAATVLANLPDLDIPNVNMATLTPYTDPSVSYEERLEIRFNATDQGSEIMNAFVVYSVNGSDFTRGYFQEISDGRYYFQFYTFAWKTTVEYYIIIQDYSYLSQVILNPVTNKFFSFEVVDLEKPIYYNLSLGGLLKGAQLPDTDSFNYGPDGGGYIGLNIMEPENASGIADVVLSFYVGNNETLAETYHLTRVNVEGTIPYYYKEITSFQGSFLRANSVFHYTITITDKAGNSVQIEGTKIIEDLTPPILLGYIKRPFLGKVTQGDQAEIEVNVTDFEELGGSGIANVTIFWTNNISLPISAWNNATMDYIETKGTYYYAIPTDKADENIYFFVRIYDKFGNFNSTGAYNKDGTLSSTTDPNSPPSNVFVFYVQRNWSMIIIITASVVAGMVILYAVYKFRGSYLDRMRRTSVEAARLIQLEEIFTKIYYGTIDKLNSIGEKINRKIKQMQLRETISDWLGEQAETRGMRIVRTIGSWIGIFMRYGFYVLSFAVVIILFQYISKASELSEIEIKQDFGIILAGITLFYLSVYTLSLKSALKLREEKATFIECFTTMFYIVLLTDGLIAAMIGVFLSEMSLGLKIFLGILFGLIILLFTFWPIKQLHSLTTGETIIVLFLTFTGLSFITSLMETTFGKVKVKRMIWMPLVGFILIAATVAKYFGEAFYPIRAVFFIDFGLLLFIIGFAAIIGNLFYKLVAR